MSISQTAKIIQAINYLLGKLKKTDKLKIVKLMYLADKCHLLRYGRTITDDDYLALPMGPIGSLTLDVLNCNPATFDENAIKTIQEHIIRVDANIIENNNRCRGDFDMLSETDIEVIDFIIDKFGRRRTPEIVKYTHDNIPEWKQFENLFKNNIVKSKPIPIENLLLLTGTTDPLFVPERHIQAIKRILQGE